MKPEQTPLIQYSLLLLLAISRTYSAVRLSPLSINLGAPPTLTGALQPNNFLSRTEKYKFNHVDGAESFVHHNGHIYTVSANGMVLDITECRTRKVARIGGDFCFGNACGRPVALRVDSQGRLIVADTVKGIIKIEPQTGKQQVLYSAVTKVKNRPSRFVNDLAVARDGTVVFSDTSSKWTRNNFFYGILESEATGRIMAYSPAYKKTLVLYDDNLKSPTGVEFTDDEKSLLIAEAGRARIIKLNLTPGPKFRQLESFAENLPGFPEHIRRSGRGTYWVAMSISRNENVTSILDRFGTRPKTRALAAMIASHDQLVKISSKYGMVVELDQSGRIIRSLQDPTGESVGAVTEVMEQDGYLYLGSLDNRYVRRVPLTKSLHVERFISKIKSTCRARKSNINKLRQLLKRLVALAEFRKVLLRAKERREEMERQRQAMSTTTTSSPEVTSPSTSPTTTSTSSPVVTSSIPTSTAAAESPTTATATASTSTAPTTAAQEVGSTASTTTSDPEAPPLTTSTTANPEEVTQSTSTTTDTSTTGEGAPQETSASTAAPTTSTAAGTGETTTTTTSAPTASQSTASASTTVSTTSATASSTPAGPL